MLYLLWSYLSMQLTLFYSSNLRAVLLKPELERPMTSPEDVVATGLPVLVPDLPDLRRMLDEHPSEAVRRMGHAAERDGGIYQMFPPKTGHEDDVRRQMTGRYVCNIYCTLLQHYQFLHCMMTMSVDTTMCSIGSK